LYYDGVCSIFDVNWQDHDGALLAQMPPRYQQQQQRQNHAVDKSKAFSSNQVKFA
jgi:hypothetical protein